MTQRKKPTPLNELGERLERLREREEGGRRRTTRITDPRGGLGLAMRIGVELVAALIVGAGAGLLVDWWLGTRPWAMVVGFVLGAAAGMLNVYRVMSGMGQAVGYRRAEERKDEEPPED